MTTRFSIAIPVFNRREYLRSAIQSCLVQTESDLEIIVSDDASSQDLRSVVTDFDDSRVKYFRSDVRLGAVQNHARAVSLCGGTFVLTLNSDDMLLPGCLSETACALQREPKAAAVYFSMTRLQGSRVSGFQPMPKVSFADAGVFQLNRWLEKFHGTSPSCCLFRLRAFERLGGYRTSLKLAYDWDLYMRFLIHGGGVVFLPLVLGVYRLHSEQMLAKESIDGLTDMLQLWSLDEYSHFTESDMAGLALSQLITSVRARSGVMRLIGLLQESGHAFRLIRGTPAALLARARDSRLPPRKPEPNYIVPSNMEGALNLAKAVIGG